MIIPDIITGIRKELPPTTKLVAVSKFKPVEDIMEAYKAGQREFGENRPQELQQKMQILPADIKWHFIGHLQSNKIKMIIDNVYLIQSVDSLHLAEEINKVAGSRSVVKDCLLQMHIAIEETKQGFSESELYESIDQLIALKNLRICGLMGMASYVSETGQIKNEFKTLKDNFQILKRKYFPNSEYFKELSMGMSNDYKIAVEMGSTIVRIGSGIFGSR